VDRGLRCVGVVDPGRVPAILALSSAFQADSCLGAATLMSGLAGRFQPVVATLMKRKRGADRSGRAPPATLRLLPGVEYMATLTEPQRAEPLVAAHVPAAENATLRTAARGRPRIRPGGSAPSRPAWECREAAGAASPFPRSGASPSHRQAPIDRGAACAIPADTPPGRTCSRRHGRLRPAECGSGCRFSHHSRVTPTQSGHQRPAHLSGAIVSQRGTPPPMPPGNRDRPNREHPTSSTPSYIGGNPPLVLCVFSLSLRPPIS
jgi:hypothetical protein